jgi:enterochelin esterase-like enzyme
MCPFSMAVMCGAALMTGMGFFAGACLAANDEPKTLLGPRGESPRIAQLKQQLNAGNAAAIEDFWKEIINKGTPLVEAIPGNSQDVLVTFLWRDDGNTQNVAIQLNALDEPASAHMMSRLPGTDVWYRTYKTRNTLRNSYLLSINDTGKSVREIKDMPEEQAKPLKANWRIDPLNPLIKDGVRSVVALGVIPFPNPGDIEHADVPKGEVTEQHLQSKVMNEDRMIWLYTPPGFKKEAGPYPLLVHFDGRTYTQDNPKVPVALDNLIQSGGVKPLVAAFIRQQARDKELNCNPIFADYLALELLPWLQQNYGVTKDPAEIVTAGSSMGGLGAAYVAFYHPECFGNAICQSGAFRYGPDNSRDGWLIKQIAASPKLPLRFYLNGGLIETPAHLAGIRQMRDALLAKGYPLRYYEFNGTHTTFSRDGTLADALVHLIGRQKDDINGPPEGMRQVPPFRDSAARD